MVKQLEDAPVWLVDAHYHRETPLASSREVFHGLRCDRFRHIQQYTSFAGGSFVGFAKQSSELDRA